MVTQEEILKKATLIGGRAPVDVVPDPTSEGFHRWKEDLLTYFGCAIDNFVAENHLEKFTDEMFAAMKNGFRQLVVSQPYVKEPLQPMEPLPRETELVTIEEVFSELKVISHHCTH